MGKKIQCRKLEENPPKNIWLPCMVSPLRCRRGTRPTRQRWWVPRPHRKCRTWRKAVHLTTHNSNGHYSNRSFWRKTRRPSSRRRERPVGYPVSSQTWVTAWYVSTMGYVIEWHSNRMFDGKRDSYFWVYLYDCGEKY